MATVPAPSTVQVLSSSTHLHSSQADSIPIFPFPPNPDPEHSNPRSALSRPSSPCDNLDPPPPPPPPPSAPPPSLPAVHLQPPPSLRAASSVPPPLIPPICPTTSSSTPLPPPLLPSSAVPPRPEYSAQPPPPPLISLPPGQQPAGPQSSHVTPPLPRSAGPSLRQQPSYALVAKGPRGPGFVRAHAQEVEAFARLPRTGTNIICGSREGIPSFSFVHADLPKVEKLYSNALVMKFLGGRPSLEASHKEISSWGIAQPFTIGPLNSRAFLLRFQDENDLLKVLSRPSSTLITFSYRIFRWHNLCHLKEDSCLAPVWISLPRLPLQCFIPEFLEAVGNKIGRFLCLDKATATLARPSAARLCVEIDLRKTPTDSIWVGLFDGFKQPILYDRMPKFCHGCYAQGHSHLECSKKSLDNPNHLDTTRLAAQKSSTPSARQFANASPNSENDPNSTTSNTHANPPPPPNITPDSWTNFAAANHHVNIPTHQLQSNQTEPILVTSPTVATGPQPSPKYPGQRHQIPAEHSTQQKIPLPSDISSQRKSKSKQQKSVALNHQQSNLEANQVFWDAVNRQVATLDQARLRNPAVDSNSHNPLASLSPNNPQSSVNHPPSSCSLCSAQGHMDVECPSGHREATSEQVQPHQSSFKECTPTVCQNDAVLTETPAAVFGHEEGTPSVCHNAELHNYANNGNLVVDQQIESIKDHPTSTAKPTKLKQLDKDRNPSLNQQQQEALERFKKKVRAQTQSLGQQLIGSNSMNPFEALIEDQSDDEDDDYTAASFNSDTDEGLVEPMDMGYQSADGRSSHNHTKSSAPGMKTNKRHPNIPLNVRLRARKNSYSSSHKYLCM